MGCHALLQGIFPTQGSNSRLLQLLHCRRILYCHQVSPCWCFIQGLISSYAWTSVFSLYFSLKLSNKQCIFFFLIKKELAFVAEKAMATHSSTLTWKIPWTEDTSSPQSMGSLRVGHDWATSLSLLTFMYWRRTWQPTPVFLPEAT